MPPEQDFRRKGHSPSALSAHVLVVEDDADVLALLEVHLTKLGARVTRAASGEEAMERAEQDPPDVVIADIILPGLDGRELYDALRSAPRTARTPIIAATVLEREEIGRHFDGCISKPFDRADVARVLAPFLEDASAKER